MISKKITLTIAALTFCSFAAEPEKTGSGMEVLKKHPQQTVRSITGVSPKQCKSFPEEKTANNIWKAKVQHPPGLLL